MLESDTDDIVIAFSEELRPAAYTVAAKLREQGRSVDVQLMPGKKIQWYVKRENGKKKFRAN